MILVPWHEIGQWLLVIWLVARARYDRDLVCAVGWLALALLIAGF